MKAFYLLGLFIILAWIQFKRDRVLYFELYTYRFSKAFVIMYKKEISFQHFLHKIIYSVIGLFDALNESF